MGRQHSERNRTAIARAILAMDSYWGEQFGADGFGDLNFCDLFTEMWLKRDEPLRKTDLYSFMPNISPRTAVKYVQQAIDSGHLREAIAPDDRRVHHVTLAPALMRRIESFLDYTFDHFRAL